MCEFKLRAWDKNTDTMIKDYAKVGSYGELHVASFHSNAYSGSTGCPNLIIMAYIGRKDKNNTEIYEGDILDRLGVVVYFPKKAHFALEQLGEIHHEVTFEELSVVDLEVVGNVHENPELFNIYV